MKICIFCSDSKIISGANLSMMDWVNDDEDNDFVIVIPKKNKHFKDCFKNENVTVLYGWYCCIYKYLTKVPVKYNIRMSLKKIFMLLIGKFSLHRLSKIISALNVDVIISNSFANVYGAVIAQKCCIPHIWHVREFMELDHKITHYNNQKIRSMCEKSYAIFISEVIEKYYLKKYKFIDYKTIYNQIQLKNNFKLEAKFKSEIINIIMVGALTIGKGQLEAIRAVELVAESGKKVNLDIYGEGPFNHELKKYIQNKQLDYVHLKGVSNNITELRKQYDVALMCSDSEALGRVTVEAMYYGNLIIGANCGCTPYIISDGITGYLYEKGDYEDLAQKILMLYGNPVRNNEIIMNAREYAILNFSKSIKPKIEQFICSIISPET